jgi:hypothetical protein
MTPAEAQVLLSMASAYDNRKPDADAAKAWAAALDGLRFDDCRAALIEHYKASAEWLMPSMIRTAVKRMRRDRVLAYGMLPDPPAHLDPDNAAAYIAWQKSTRRAIADGELPERVVITGPRRDVASLGLAGKHIPDHIDSARAAKEQDHE